MSEDISLNLIAERILAGWKIEYCSCNCGGRIAWFKPADYGSYTSEGCVCHNTPHDEWGDGFV